MSDQAPGASLRQAAEGRGDVRIGFAMAMGKAGNGDAAYLETAAREFNMVVAENSMKWGSLARRGRKMYDFDDADAIVYFAERHGMKVRGHTLVWHSQQPGWLSEGEWSRDEMIEIMREHIKEVAGRYRGRVDTWDVVNEAIDGGEDPNSLYRDTNFYRVIGPEFMDMAFQFAREADPNARLFYNDYGMDFGGRKFEKMFQVVSGMVERGVPIDGVGFQMHTRIDARHDTEAMLENFARLGELGLAVEITEMDVAIPLPCDEEKLTRQAEVYGHIVGEALKAENLTAVVLWGFTDKHSWIPRHTEGARGCALIFDENYAPKPAYRRLVEVFASP